MAGNPLIDMLESNIKKFKSSSEHINKKFKDLIPEEKEAFPLLKDWWQTNDFNAQKCEELLKTLAKGSNKHPADMELLENLQEFRTICKSYYVKDKDAFEKFQKELGGKKTSAPQPQPTPQPKPQPQPTPQPTPQPQPQPMPQPQPQQEKPVNTLIEMLAFNVKKWNETTDFLYKKYDLLIPEEKQALAELDEYWNKNDFNAAKCEKLLEMMALGKKKHPADLDLLEALQDYRRLCRDYYTKDKEFFIAFQKAMGGKGSKKSKPQPQPQQQQSQPQPKRETKFGDKRIDYPNGDYYIGEYDNEMPNGKGKYYHYDGSWREGNFVNGELNGKNCSKRNEKNKYTERGEYTNGECTGSGKTVWDNGDWYEGEWDDEGANGKGEFHYKNKKWKKGNFKKNQLNGKGEYHFADGDWQKGNFENDELHGKGEWYYIEYKQTCIGNFNKNRCEGKGQIVWDNGQRYVGTWDETLGSFSGKGVMYYPDGGGKAKGIWVNGSWVIHSSSDGGGGFSFSGGGIGSWIWENLVHVPWVATLIILAVELITKGMSWNVLWIALGGAVVSFILYIAISLVQNVLEWLWEHKIILFIILALIGARVLYKMGVFTFDGFNKKVPETEAAAVVALQPNYYCNSNAINVRDKPSANAKVVGKLNKNQEVYVYAYSAVTKFAQIELDGKRAYVMAKFLKPKDPSAPNPVIPKAAAGK